MTTLHDFRMKTLASEVMMNFEELRGRAVLVVNVASQCGLTPQYQGLEELHEKYEGRGLTVLGFPCNQFGGQEPGTEADIAELCRGYGVKFPMFSKIQVNGTGAHELFQWLKREPTEPEGPGDLTWNFTKFLAGKSGRVLARFSPKTTPDDPRLVQAIERALD